MLIDWFTVFAQIFNFLVLVLLLRRFLYRPIMRAMHEREARIAAQLNEAEALKQEATQEVGRYHQQQEALENERESLLFQAKEDAEAMRKSLVKQAREEIEAARTRWHEVIRQEQHEFLEQVRQRLSRLVADISRRALADLADADLEQQVIEVLIRRIVALGDTERQAFAEAIRASGGSVVLRSAFEVPEPLRDKICRVVSDHFDPATVTQFDVAPELICGIEVRIRDFKLAWTLVDYLDSVEAALVDTVATDSEKHYER